MLKVETGPDINCISLGTFQSLQDKHQGACDNRDSKLTVYFTINTAFTNYLEMFPNLTDSLKFPLIKDRTTYEQILPVSLNFS